MSTANLGKKKVTQNDRVFDYLKSKGELNPLTAWVELGVYRLSAVIYDLRHMGINIETGRKTVYNKFGEPCVVANYKMEEVAQ